MLHFMIRLVVEVFVWTRLLYSHEIIRNYLEKSAVIIGISCFGTDNFSVFYKII